MAKMQYRFVGTEAMVGGIRMDRFGQRFEIDEKFGEQARKGGAALLTEEEFSTFGFEPDELKIWGDPMMSEFEVPSDSGEVKAKFAFIRKRDAARLMYRDIRQGLLDPQSKMVIDHKDGEDAQGEE